MKVLTYGGRESVSMCTSVRVRLFEICICVHTIERACVNVIVFTCIC